MAPTKHSVVGASGASRWIPCPGSVALSEGLPNWSSEYADEGTVAHGVAEICLREQRDAWEFVGEKRTLLADAGREADFETVVNTEMANGVQLYLDHVASLLCGRGYKEVFVERKVSLPSVDERSFGTVDCGILAIHPANHLHVVDFKYGYDPVEVEWNPQALDYATSLYFGLDKAAKAKIKHVTIHVVQPRAPHQHGPVRSWSLSIADLVKWTNEVLAPALAATKDPDAARVVGAAQCKHCPARLVCPELLGVVENVTEAAAITEHTDRSLMPDSHLGALMKLEKPVKSFYKALNDEVFRRLSKGADVGGFKLVAKTGDRVWRDGAVAALEAGLPGVSLRTEPKFFSPAAVGRISSVAKGLVAQWAFKPDRGFTVAPESDIRPAVRRDPATVFAGMQTQTDAN